MTRETDSFIRNLTRVWFPVRFVSWATNRGNTFLNKVGIWKPCCRWMQSVLNLLCTLCFTSAAGRRFSLLASRRARFGVLVTIKSNLPSEKEEFAQLLFSNSLLDGYHRSLLNQTAFGMCFTDTVPNLYSVTLWSGFSGLDLWNGLRNVAQSCKITKKLPTDQEQNTSICWYVVTVWYWWVSVVSLSACTEMMHDSNSWLKNESVLSFIPWNFLFKRLFSVPVL